MNDTITLELPYGDGSLPTRLPAGRTDVIEPVDVDPAPDPVAELVRAMREPISGPPLRSVVRRGGTVAISVCDGTRPQPRRDVIPALLSELEDFVRLDDVTILVATGTHRGNTSEELIEMFGADVLSAVEVVNHDARDQAGLGWVGALGDDVPVWLNKRWLEADIRITTGFVEPHFFAGFSGGPKMVAPGLAGLETTLTLHDARRISSGQARWGVTHGNPIHDDVRAIARATGVDFALDVTLDREQRLVRAYGGELEEMHRRACEDVRRTAMRGVRTPYDVVVTTNGGAPLDQNLYQCVKGMSAAAQVAGEGAMIVCAAECRDGFPDHGDYRRQLTAASGPAELLDDIATRRETIPDQWQIQIQAMIQLRHRVVVRTSYLSDAELSEAHLEQTHDIEELVERALAKAGPDARVCVLPQGPQTIPYLDPR
jgi:nickel-dependent lactate racemase